MALWLCVCAGLMPVLAARCMAALVTLTALAATPTQSQVRGCYRSRCSLRWPEPDTARALEADKPAKKDDDQEEDGDGEDSQASREDFDLDSPAGSG